MSRFLLCKVLRLHDWRWDGAAKVVPGFGTVIGDVCARCGATEFPCNHNRHWQWRTGGATR